MPKLIDLNYHASNEYSSPQEVIDRHWPSLGYVGHLRKEIQPEIIKHINYEGSLVIKNTNCHFFKNRNGFFHLPYRTHRFIREQKPDVIIIQGFVFPFQVMHLRYKVGKDCTIFLQHHGERPFKGVKKFFQKIANRGVNGYLFSSVELANTWVEQGIITHRNKCYEVMGVSTDFVKQDKKMAKQRTSMSDGINFLWVGRLNANKDPLTVIKGFETFLQSGQNAKLVMIYQEKDLLDHIRSYISSSRLLNSAVNLVGKINHHELPYWFSAADFYISGSHREGSGYALIEAMACGCIPVVTNIPSFRKITGDGACGILYEAGNAEQLSAALLKTKEIDLEQEQEKVLYQFKTNLSFEAYANQVQAVVDGALQKLNR